MKWWLPCLVVVLMLTACTEVEREEIRVGISAAPISLDPRLATDAVSYRICRLVYSALVDFDDNFQPVPGLANWRVVSPTVYRFILAPASFHDGRALTSADVVATYEAVRDPALRSPHRGSLANIAHIEARDAHIIEFTLKRADPLFPGVLAIGIVPASQRHRVIADHSDAIGSGPFAVVSPLRASGVTLARREDGQRVNFAVIGNETVRALKLARGELDILQGGLSPELSRWLAARENIAVSDVGGTTFTYLGVNFATGPTADVRVRRALAHALDRDALIDHVMRNKARLARSLLAPEHWAGMPAQQDYPHDPTRARALLAEAGYGEGRPLHLTYKTSTDPFRLRLAEIIQAQLKAVGIDIEIRSHDWGTFYGDIKAGRFELYSLSWVGLKMPDIFRYVFHSTAVPPAGANRSRYKNDAVDALIDSAEETTDIEQRIEQYHALQELLLKDLAYIPLWYEDTVIAVRNTVTDYRVDAHGNYDGLVHVSKKPPSLAE